MERLTARIRDLAGSVLYPVINVGEHDPEFLRRLLDDLAAEGVAIAQARHKSVLDEAARDKFAMMSQMCIDQDIALIVNDDPELAASIGAAGVHLGREDMSLRQAGEYFSHGLFGKTCRCLEHCEEAFSEGAAYAALGAMYASFSKPGAPVIGPEELKRSRTGVGPGPLLVAIGGIDEYNFRTVLQAGADLVAAVTVFLDPAHRKRTLSAFRRPAGGLA